MKHDEKKQSNALNMQFFTATASLQQPPMHQAAYGHEVFDPSYYRTDLDPAAQAYTMDDYALRDPNVAQHISNYSSFEQMSQTGANLSQPALSTQDALMQSLSKAGYPVNLVANSSQLMGDPSAQLNGNSGYFHGYETNVDLVLPSEQSVGYNDLLNNYDGTVGGSQTYPIGHVNPQVSSAAMSSDLMQNTLIASNEEMKLLDASAATSETDVSTALARWADSFSTLGDSFNPTAQGGMNGNLAPTSLEASQLSWASGDQSSATLFNQDASQEQFNQPTLPFSSSDQPHAFSTPQSLHVQSPESVNNPSVFTTGKFVRRNSSTSALADSLSNVGIASSQPLSPSAWPSKKPSSIAVRRRRPPLSALGPAALSLPNGEQLVGSGAGGAKSASQIGSLPLSPNHVSHGQPSAEHKLRRIRSTGLSGGRIQKSSSGSAQRSPLHFSFSEASSPRSTKQSRNHHSAFHNGLLAGPTNTVPPTPLSPDEIHGDGLNIRRISTNPLRNRYGDMEAPPAFYTGSTPATAGSTPGTPMGFAAVPPVPHLAASQLYRDKPPQSAPASQQSFPQSALAPNAQATTDTQSQSRKQSVEGSTGPIRRPSLPFGAEANGEEAQAHFAVPMVNDDGNLEMGYPLQYRETCFEPSQQFQMSQQVQQLSHAVNSHAKPKRNNAHDMPLAFRKANQAIVQSSQSQTAPMPDLMVHEYSPPKVDGQKYSPPPPLRSNHDGRPKNYTFENAGPEHFQGSTAR